MNRRNWIILIVILIVLIGLGVLGWWMYKTGKISPKADVTTTTAPITTKAGNAHLFINGVDKGSFVEASIGSSGDDQQVYEATWTTKFDQWTDKGDRTTSFSIDDARAKLRAQNPEIKILSTTGEVLGTAHLFINGVDKGKFIETSISTSGSDQQVYEATWTTDTNQWVDKEDRTTSSALNDARAKLRAQKPEVKIIATDGTILGTAKLLINNIDKGKFIETSIGSSGRDQQVYHATWTTDIDQWNKEGDRTSLSSIDDARALLKAQNPDIVVTYTPSSSGAGTVTPTNNSNTNTNLNANSNTTNVSTPIPAKTTPTTTPSAPKTTTTSATTGPEIPIAGGGILGLLFLTRYLVNRKISK